MEISWKLLNLCLGLLLFQLCNGFPINLENNAADSHSQLLTGLLAVLLTVCSVVFLAGCLCCQRRNGFKEFRDSPVVASTSSNLDHGIVNPIANREFTIFTPLSPPHQNNNVFLANQQTITRTPDDYRYGDVDVSYWFDGKEKDFPRIKLKYIRELGRGWFGKVVEGAAQTDDQQWNQVVVRILDASAPSKERMSFLHDASIYRCGSHPNMVGLVGRCLDTVPLLILQEHCDQGDLKQYLRENKKFSDNSVLSTEYPLIWCCQVTSALKHLHDNNITHPDLAARNCQLTSNLTLKLGDYGLSLHKYPDDYYQGSPGVSVRWCAPESLNYTKTTIQPNVVTKEANIWTLGVTMWEICECGAQPYAYLTDDEVISQVFGAPNVRLSRPSFTVLYTDYIYRLMQLCWTNTESRPAVAQIDLMLADLLQVHKNTSQASWPDCSMSADDFDKRWESFKPNDIVKMDNQDSELQVQINKTLSPSLNNLHGSLDNLLVEKVASNELQNKRVEFEDTDVLEKVPYSLEPLQSRIEFKLGPANHDSLTDSLLQRNSSGSETEDETWKKKIERGAYTEKVRLKSRSVADLMVLTHIDYSESESETPLPSLDYRVNYKNVRISPKTNMENASMIFGSEGNLLSVHDTFEDELKKLQEERRDSMLFVPDSNSYKSPEESPSKRLMQELNSGIAIQPAEQVYNVFNVTIDKYTPLHVNSDKLNQIINLKSANLDTHIKENGVNKVGSDDIIIDICSDINESQKLIETERENVFNIKEVSAINEVKIVNEDISNDVPTAYPSGNIQNDNVPQSPSSNDIIQNEPLKLSASTKINNVITCSIEDNRLIEETLPNVQNANSSKNTECKQESISNGLDLPNLRSNNECLFTVPKLIDIIQNNDALMEFIIANYDSLETENDKSNPVISNQDISLLVDEIPRDSPNLYEVERSKSNEDIPSILDEQIGKENITTEEKFVEETKLEFDISKCDENTNLDANFHEEDSATEDIAAEIVNNKSNLDLSKDEEILALEENNPEEKQERKAAFDLSKDQEVHLSGKPKVAFDLSKDQEATMPNSLTHSSVFTSTPFRKKNLQDLTKSLEDSYTSLNLYDMPKDEEEELQFSSNFSPLDKDEENLNYSLETWDNFLGKTMDNQNNEFDSFTSEPQSLLFTENDKIENQCNKTVTKEKPLNGTFNLNETANLNGTYVKDKTVNVEGKTEKILDKTTTILDKTTNMNGTYVKEDDANSTFILNEKLSGTFVKENANTTYDVEDGNRSLEEAPGSESEGTWESGGGWFLHPQSDDVSGDMQVSKSSSDSYVGFSMDDEIMAAIRNELLTKLPHAQGVPNDNVKEDEEQWETTDRNEVFLRYNVYNTPLSPIPEESYIEDNSEESTPRQISSSSSYCSDEYEDDEDDDVAEEENLPQDTETPSPHQLESSARNPLHRHTPSQDSCCSNDTLFNLEELTCATTEQDKELSDKDKENTQKTAEDTSPNNDDLKNSVINDMNHTDNVSEINHAVTITVDNVEIKDKEYIEDFLVKERVNSSDMAIVKVAEASEESSPQESTGENENLPFLNKQFVPPLPSPEDKPWKQLPASMLSYDKIVSQNNKLLPVSEVKNVPEETNYENLPIDDENKDQNVPEEILYENTKSNFDDVKTYENIDNVSDIYNEADYMNIVNYENTKNAKLIDDKDEVDKLEQNEDLIIHNLDEEDPEYFGVLTDIRFNGPSDSQLMSTSFSESNDNDEQEWDSGSDTRSSSSGEFIWKEGEHEESLKALRAAPQDVDLKPMEGIMEEAYSESSVSSSGSTSDEGEIPEFVPSAWDKFATPVKSALRSPEKTLEKDEKKSKGVSFKKQKYHCVYEYPREPESPVLHGQDLWKSQTDFNSFADWEFDADTYLPPPTDDNEILSQNNYAYQQNLIRSRNLYQLTNISTHPSITSEDFFISSSTRPFDIGGLSSQFFPGNNAWATENMTPDSGVDDNTPGSLVEDYQNIPSIKHVLPLKKLASEAVQKTKANNLKNQLMGGLRHTRDKLKLDLPPSPSAFTVGKGFSMEPNVEPVVLREKPTFSTFGKSRFLVQHVDTPPDGSDNSKNVSFEALPYKPVSPEERLNNENTDSTNQSSENSPEAYQPLEKQILKGDFELDKSKTKVEFVRGEASLLDSADEDSGIESSTLERKLSNVV